MESDRQAAVADPPVIKAPEKDATKSPQKGKPKRMPPYAVVVLNDDHHSYEYVIATFRKVFGYDETKCFLLAEEIDTTGRAIVWTGPKEVAELKRDQIRSATPEFQGQHKVDFPLGVLIEPLPQ
jgi:ATP-dependent Clp protease adaptor protein ClpS